MSINHIAKVHAGNKDVYFMCIWFNIHSTIIEKGFTNDNPIIKYSCLDTPKHSK